MPCPMVRTAWARSAPPFPLCPGSTPNGSLDGHMGQSLKQPHSNFVFELLGNPRLGLKWRPRKAESVCGGKSGLARVRDRHSVIQEAQRETTPALL